MKLFIPYFFLFLTLSGCISKTPVDLIVHNATIYSINDENAIFEAMAINNGKIIAIGKENQILNKYTSVNKVDALNQYIYPGFIDAHCHFLGYGLTLDKVDLTNTNSFDEVVERCKKYAQQTNNKWITGRGWDNTKWENKAFPKKELLDKAFPNRPVFIRRIDGHAGIANQYALDLAQITDSTKIKGGKIVKENGKITGLLIDNAVELVLNIIPKPDLNQKKKALLSAQRNCLAVGLTTVDDAGLDKEDVELIEKLHQTGELSIRIYAMLNDTKENFDYYLENGTYQTERLTINAFKFYGDGALGSKGACLLKPYTNDTTKGFLLKDTTHFKKYAHLLYEKGFQMCTHAIGDSTVRFILNTYGEVLQGTNDRRWRIEHAQIVDSSDFNLFRKYTIIPSVQPTHATSDMDWVSLVLGKKRTRFGYAYQDLLKQNGWLPLGTDFPIEDINPIVTFYAAVARKNKDGLPKNGFQIKNALTRDQALRGMTIWAALSNFEEEQKGSLEVGKVADFVLLNKDLFTVAEDAILTTKVTATYINGVQVY